MKRIPLTQDKYALVDDKDYEWLNQYKWAVSRGYAIRTDRTNGKRTVHMHRQIMNTPKGMQTDHIDHDTLNNQRGNLRNCSFQENQRNKRITNNKTSTYKGVRKRSKYRWEARIAVGKNHISIGGFDQERHAALAYDLWAKFFFGEYAYTNFPVVNN